MAGDAGLSRREFMRFSVASGFALGSAPLSPALNMLGVTAAVGVLLPASRRSRATSFVAGMRAGGSSALNIRTFEGLRDLRVQLEAWSGRMETVVAWLTESQLDALHDVVSGMRLIVVNMGENVQRTALASGDLLNTLNLWQAHYAAGQWAAARFGGRGLMSAALLESGYDHVYAFGAGVEAAGGSLLARVVTHHPTARRMEVVIDAARQLRPDFIFGAYSGTQADDFAAALRKAGIATPLVGAGGYQPVSWAAALPTPENRAFLAAFRKHSLRPADAFAALGYETAQLVDGHSVTSPRGALLAAGRMVSPLFIADARTDGRATLAALTQPDEDAFTAVLKRATEKTGWIMPYLA